MKKMMTVALTLLCVVTQTGAFAFAADQSTKDGQTLEQAKVEINKAGVGEKARVTIKFKDGTERKGYVAERHDEDFVLRDHKTDSPSVVRYADVAWARINRGHSTARNTALGVGIGAGAVLVTRALLIASLDD